MDPRLLLSMENEVFRTLVFYVVVLMVKVIVLVLMTGFWRQKKAAYMYPEDAKAFYAGKGDASKITPNHEDPDVEKIRRNHHNDLENIPFFILLGILYILTDPTPSVAIWHFRIYAVTRVMHTIFYQMGVQPWRAMFFGMGAMMMTSMLAQLLMAVW